METLVRPEIPTIVYSQLKKFLMDPDQQHIYGKDLMIPDPNHQGELIAVESLWSGPALTIPMRHPRFQSIIGTPPKFNEPGISVQAKKPAEPVDGKQEVAIVAHGKLITPNPDEYIERHYALLNDGTTITFNRNYKTGDTQPIASDPEEVAEVWEYVHDEYRKLKSFGQVMQ